MKKDFKGKNFQLCLQFYSEGQSNKAKKSKEGSEAQARSRSPRMDHNPKQGWEVQDRSRSPCKVENYCLKPSYFAASAQNLCLLMFIAENKI